MHKRTLRLVYKMEVATFEDLLLKDNSWTVHENNITMVLIEIYKSINKVHQSWQIFFYLKNTRHDLRNKQLLKLPKNSTSR